MYTMDPGRRPRSLPTTPWGLAGGVCRMLPFFSARRRQSASIEQLRTCKAAGELQGRGCGGTWNPRLVRPGSRAGSPAWLARGGPWDFPCRLPATGGKTAQRRTRLPVVSLTLSDGMERGVRQGAGRRATAPPGKTYAACQGSMYIRARGLSAVKEANYAFLEIPACSGSYIASCIVSCTHSCTGS